MPTETQWQEWFDQWWHSLTPDDLPYLAPVLATRPKHTWAIALTLQLTTDDGIQALNRDYRNSDRPTDVLAFAALEGLPPAILMAQLQGGALSPEPLPESITPETITPELIEPDPIEEPLELGDIIISLDTAQTQAQTLGHSLSLELAWLATHGMLHLVGWDHPDPKHLQIMLRRQQSLLTAANLGRVNWGAIQATDLGYV
ncbi:MAG: rRNA maturation RNase YbeY [Cyanobacteria bacterium P01_H01_bin.130]